MDCPVCDDGTCLACTQGGEVRRLAESDPAYRALFARLWREAKARGTSTPSLLARAAGFAGAVANHVAHGCPKVPPEEKARRLAICRACPWIRDDGETCGKCRCYMPVKAGWALSECPDRPPRW